MYVPPIRNRSPEVFPNKFLTEITSDFFSHLKTFEDKSRKEYFENLTLDAYLADFDRRPSLYDLHEINFQNFILRVTEGKSNEELIKLSITTHAYKRIVRGRCYAIASRADLDWQGNPGASKQEALEEIWTSLKLYDWHLAPSDELEAIEEKRKSLQLNCEFSTMAVDTQTAIEKFTKRFPGKKIAWLNLANGHNCCGTYNVAFGGSQEEMVASVCTAAATLGLCARIVDDSFRVKVQKGEHHVVYRRGLHIPPGGNYFSKTKFLLSDPQIDCYMIAAAFADFRYYLPGFTTYTERGDYYSWFGYGSSPKSESELTKRLLIDIEGETRAISFNNFLTGVCLTAVKEGVEVLILGAGGCGAFLHSAWRDSKLWKEVLDKYANCFEAVTFAILPDKRRPENVQAFEKYFPILE